MGLQVVNGALCACSFGAAPSSLVVLPKGVNITNQPAATIMDNIPFMNVMPFGVCSSLANPAVAAATAAALGVLTPMPCTPVPAGPWAPGVPPVTIKGIPVLDDASKLSCAYAGVITISFAGQAVVSLP